MKEYEEAHGRCQSMLQRLEEESGESISVIDIERRVYALAKRAHQTSGTGIGSKMGMSSPRNGKE